MVCCFFYNKLFYFIYFFLKEFEVTAHYWKTPCELISSLDAKLAPPTWITVSEISNFRNLKELKEFASKDRDLTPIMPTYTHEGSTVYACLPGDKESSTPISKEAM